MPLRGKGQKAQNGRNKELKGKKGVCTPLICIAIQILIPQYKLAAKERKEHKKYCLYHLACPYPNFTLPQIFSLAR